MLILKYWTVYGDQLGIKHLSAIIKKNQAVQWYKEILRLETPSMTVYSCFNASDNRD